MEGAGAGAGAACAACKYQRRRCTPECPLAPYFPQDRPRVFRNAHRLFGVSNILKTLDRAAPHKRHEAMDCIVYESQAWDVYPSSGCVTIIHDLLRRIRQAEHDLRCVRAAVQAYQHHSADAGSSSSSSSPPPPAPPPPPFRWTTAVGGDHGGIVAHGRQGGDPFVMYGADQQHTPPLLQTPPPPPWITQQQPQNLHDIQMSATIADTATAGGRLHPHLAQQDYYPFLIDAADATTMVPQSQHQQHVQPAPELQDNMMSYFVDGMDDGDNNEMPPESSMDSSNEKAMKMEDVNDFKHITRTKS